MFDEASSSLAEMALIASPTPGAALEGNALTYAAEGFKITEQARARSLLDMLSESGTAVTEGVPAELLKRKQDNLDRQQEIAELLTELMFPLKGRRRSPPSSKLSWTNYKPSSMKLRTRSG